MISTNRIYSSLHVCILENQFPLMCATAFLSFCFPIMKMPRSWGRISYSRLCRCWILMVSFMETTVLIWLDMISTENGKIPQRLITLRYIIFASWSAVYRKWGKWSSFATYMATRWKRMLLYMAAMTLLILTAENSFPCSWAVSFKASRTKIALFWIGGSRKELVGLCLLDSWDIAMCMP